MTVQSDKNDETAEPQGLWKLIMQIAEPTDLLRSILDRSSRPELDPRLEVTALGDRAIILHGCTVTIHQHTSPAPGSAT